MTVEQQLRVAQTKAIALAKQLTKKQPSDTTAKTKAAAVANQALTLHLLHLILDTRLV